MAHSRGGIMPPLDAPPPRPPAQACWISFSIYMQPTGVWDVSHPISERNPHSWIGPHFTPHAAYDRLTRPNPNTNLPTSWWITAEREGAIMPTLLPTPPPPP